MEFLAEEITRTILLLTRSEIEAALVAENTRMLTSDESYYGALGEPTPETPLIVPVKYHENLLPDINRKPLDQFPNVAVLTYRSDSAEDQADQTEDALYDAVIEAFCSSRDVDEVARMANRYANALLAILEANPTLQGLTAPIAFQPSITVSQAVARRESTTTDRVIYLQGCRLELTWRVTGVWRIQ